MLRIVDRMAFENKDESKNDLYKHLCELDTIPKKKDGFINHIAEYCSISKEVAESLWTDLQRLEHLQVQEKRNYRLHRVSICYSL